MRERKAEWTSEFILIMPIALKYVQMARTEVMPEDDQKDPQEGRNISPRVQADANASVPMRPAAAQASTGSSAGAGEPAPTAQSGAAPPAPKPAKANAPRQAAAPARPIEAPEIPPQPFKAAPSMPLSMTQVPSGAAKSDQLGSGATDEEFDRLIAGIKPLKKRTPSLVARWWRGADRYDRASPGEDDRHVAFDGYRSERHDAKLERDRRYGTVYAVTESAGAYLIRLELPRRLPATSLKQVWHIAAAPPAYEYTVQLDHNVIAIQARLCGEALRRLAYVSPSYPSGFLTRIELREPVAQFKHRLRGQTIEVIAFKSAAHDAEESGLAEPGAMAK